MTFSRDAPGLHSGRRSSDIEAGQRPKISVEFALRIVPIPSIAAPYARPDGGKTFLPSVSQARRRLTPGGTSPTPSPAHILRSPPGSGCVEDKPRPPRPGEPRAFVIALIQMKDNELHFAPSYLAPCLLRQLDDTEWARCSRGESLADEVDERGIGADQENCVILQDRVLSGEGVSFPARQRWGSGRGPTSDPTAYLGSSLQGSRRGRTGDEGSPGSAPYSVVRSPSISPDAVIRKNLVGPGFFPDTCGGETARGRSWSPPCVGTGGGWESRRDA